MEKKMANNLGFPPYSIGLNSLSLSEGLPKLGITFWGPKIKYHSILLGPLG